MPAADHSLVNAFRLRGYAVPQVEIQRASAGPLPHPKVSRVSSPFRHVASSQQSSSRRLRKIGHKATHTSAARTG
jgi:hypothetical protein